MSDEPGTRADSESKTPSRPGLVTGYLSHFLSHVYRTSRTRSRYVDRDNPTIEFETVSDFWKAARRWSLEKPPAQYISIKGAISTFAPVLPGDPGGKREIHLYTRRNYRNIRKSFEQAGRHEGPTTLDAFLAFSSGQLVIRLSPDNTPYVYLGLYHSIVRNAIPLFVERNYYFEIVENAFRHNAQSQNVIEAAIIGRLLPMPDNFVMRFLRDLNIYDSFKGAPVDRLMPRFALQVDGGADATLIQPISPARYLDGDIWVAVSDGRYERVVSRFADLADAEDVATERGALKAEVALYYGACEVLSEYDDTNWIFPEHRILATAVTREVEDGVSRAASGRATGQLPVFNTINIHGGNVTMSNDHINIHNIGGIVNVKSTLTNAVFKIEGATALDDAQRTELQELFKKLEADVVASEKTMPEEAARVAQVADLVATEVAKTKPDRSFLQITAKGLVESAKFLESVTPSIVSVVAAIVKLLLP